MLVVLLRVVLAIAYPILAHWASVQDSGVVATWALGDLALIVLLEPLLARRAWAWGLLAVIAAGLVMLAQSRYAQLPLLAPPLVFTGLLSWWFGRSLRAPRVALITRIVAGLEHTSPHDLPAKLQRYTRGLTGAWSVLLALLALANGVLALVAVPHGVLARLGHAPEWTIAQAHWSLFANFLDYGIVGIFFIGEYTVRRWVFPDRPYRNFLEFLQQLAGLGPRFWRELFH